MKENKIITIVCNSISEKVADTLAHAKTKNNIILNLTSYEIDKLIEIVHPSEEYSIELIFDPMVQCELDGLVINQYEYCNSVKIKLMNYREFLNEYVIQEAEDTIVVIGEKNEDVERILNNKAKLLTDKKYKIEFINLFDTDDLVEFVKGVNKAVNQINELSKTGTVILPHFSFMPGSEPKGKSYMTDHNGLLNFMKKSLTGNIKRCDILIS